MRRGGGPSMHPPIERLHMLAQRADPALRLTSCPVALPQVGRVAPRSCEQFLQVRGQASGESGARV